MSGKSLRIERKDFYIEYPGEFNARLVHPLIHYNTHRFKRLKEVDVLTRKLKDPTIESVFECSHANSTGCACKFVLREDNTGELVGAHKEDTNHLNDIHSWRLYIAKTRLYDDIVNDPFMSPQKLLDNLFTSSEFVIDQFSPPLSVLKNAISRLKAKILCSSSLRPEHLDQLFFSVKLSTGMISCFLKGRIQIGNKQQNRSLFLQVNFSSTSREKAVGCF